MWFMPGLTCPVTIKFTPKTRDDIQDHITVLAQTGPVDIPVNCYSKKAVPVVNTPVIELGKVTMGEIATSNLVLENKGALPVAVTLSAVDFGDEDAPSANGVLITTTFQAAMFPVQDCCVAWCLRQIFPRRYLSLHLQCSKRTAKSVCPSNSAP
jgi:hypothetical protein